MDMLQDGNGENRLGLNIIFVTFLICYIDALFNLKDRLYR